MEENKSESQTPESSAKSSASTVKIVGIVVVFAVIAFLIWQFGLKKDQSSTQNEVILPANSQNVQPTTSESIQQEPTGSTMKATYKDGTYKVEGEYTNPASKELVNVSVTLANGVITAATFAGTPDNPTTKRMQANFSDGFEVLVVGKSIDEVALTVVNGSSLTPQGFMDALQKVKVEAKS